MANATCEVWVLVDADGDYAVGKDDAGATEAYDSEYTADATRPTRLVKVVLTIPLPAVAVLSGVVPAEGEGVLSVG